MVVGCGGEEQKPPAGWEVFRNEDYGFRFWYPSDWEQFTPPLISVQPKIGFRDPVVDDFQEYVTAHVVTGVWSLESGVSVLSGIFTGMESSRDIELHGRKGHE